jgi:hypothetical protein
MMKQNIDAVQEFDTYLASNSDAEGLITELLLNIRNDLLNGTDTSETCLIDLGIELLP